MKLVSTTPVIPVAKFVAGVIDTGDKFATGLVDMVANLSPVSLIPVMHLPLRISPQILKKFEMTLMLFSGAWGKMIHEQNLNQKTL